MAYQDKAFRIHLQFAQFQYLWVNFLALGGRWGWQVSSDLCPGYERTTKEPGRDIFDGSCRLCLVSLRMGLTIYIGSQADQFPDITPPVEVADAHWSFTPDHCQGIVGCQAARFGCACSRSIQGAKRAASKQVRRSGLLPTAVSVAAEAAPTFPLAPSARQQSIRRLVVSSHANANFLTDHSISLGQKRTFMHGKNRRALTKHNWA